MPSFFRNYPKINYKFADGTTQNLVDLTVKFTLSDIVKNESSVFYPFGWRDHDRPDSLADKYYASSDYYWLVLMSNDIFDVHHDLPISAETFNEFLTERYKEDAMAAGYTESVPDVIAYCSSTVHHYEDSEGYYIDHKSYIDLPNAKAVSIYDYEFLLNESKRSVNLLEASRKNSITYELENKLRQIKSESES